MTPRTLDPNAASMAASMAAEAVAAAASSSAAASTDAIVSRVEERVRSLVDAAAHVTAALKSVDAAIVQSVRVAVRTPGRAIDSSRIVHFSTAVMASLNALIDCASSLGAHSATFDKLVAQCRLDSTRYIASANLAFHAPSTSSAFYTLKQRRLEFIVALKQLITAGREAALQLTHDNDESTTSSSSSSLDAAAVVAQDAESESDDDDDDSGDDREPPSMPSNPFQSRSRSDSHSQSDSIVQQPKDPSQSEVLPPHGAAAASLEDSNDSNRGRTPSAGSASSSSSSSPPTTTSPSLVAPIPAPKDGVAADKHSSDSDSDEDADDRAVDSDSIALSGSLSHSDAPPPSPPPRTPPTAKASESPSSKVHLLSSKRKARGKRTSSKSPSRSPAAASSPPPSTVTAPAPRRSMSLSLRLRKRIRKPRRSQQQSEVIEDDDYESSGGDTAASKPLSANDSDGDVGNDDDAVAAPKDDEPDSTVDDARLAMEALADMRLQAVRDVDEALSEYEASLGDDDGDDDYVETEEAADNDDADALYLVHRNRAEVLAELLSTERAYVAALDAIVQRYLEPLQSDKRLRRLLVNGDVTCIFQNIEMIHARAKNLIGKLSREIDTGEPVCIARLFKQFGPTMETLGIYQMELDEALVSLAMAQRKPAFSKFVRDAHKRAVDERAAAADDDGKGGAGDALSLDLGVLLLQPVVRLETYSRLLEELVRATPPDHKDFRGLSAMRTSLAMLAVRIDQLKNERTNIERIKFLEDNTKRAKGSAMPPLSNRTNRCIVREGTVKWLLLRAGTPPAASVAASTLSPARAALTISGPGSAHSFESVWCVLLDDMLLLLKQRRNSKFEYRGHMYLVDAVNVDRHANVVAFDTATHSFHVLRFAADLVAGAWHTTIEHAIEMQQIEISFSPRSQRIHAHNDRVSKS
jgi:RhoGEF domain